MDVSNGLQEYRMVQLTLAAYSALKLTGLMTIGPNHYGASMRHKKIRRRRLIILAGSAARRQFVRQLRGLSHTISSEDADQ